MNPVLPLLALALISPVVNAATSSSPDLYRKHYIASGLSVSGNIETIVSLTSDDAGKTWIPAIKPPESTNSMQNHIDAVACDRAAKHCVALGDYDSFTLAAHTSDDGGRTWQWANIEPEREGPVLTGVACDAKAQNCVAVGEHGLLGTSPLIYYSKDGGKNWTKSTAVAHEGNQHLSSVSCDKEGINCVAVGHRTEYNLHDVHKFPFTYVSHDGGLSWSESKVQPSGLSKDNVLRAVSCSNDARHCVTVGIYYRDVGHHGSKPLVYVTDDGGQSWNLSEISPDPEIILSGFSGVSCDGKGQFCVAAGTITTKTGLLPLIYKSNDAGKTWTKDIHMPADIAYSLNEVLCTKEGKQCLISGIATNPERLVTYVSEDGGLNWDVSITYLENRYHALHLA